MDLHERARGKIVHDGNFLQAVTALPNASTNPGKLITMPSQSKLRAVIFDIDGTLCDSFELGFTATNSVLQKNGYGAVTPDQYHAGTKWTTPERLARHCGVDPSMESFKDLGGKLGKEFDELYIGLVSKQTAAFYPQISELLHKLAASKKRIGALTNAAVAYAEAVLEANRVRELFEVVHGADDVPRPKPAPDGLLQICSELGESAGAAVYIGDSPSDGAAARAAGMLSIGVTWGSHGLVTVEPAFDVCVQSVQELGKCLLISDD